MKKKCALVTLLILIFFQTHLFGQNQTLAKPNRYAVAIGISNYQNPGIEKLNFAHKDAEAFANYLKSNAGGSVPQENIILLQNEKANYAAIYNALDWLVETCREGDVVYFYFSGHGDLESNTIYKLGFLLSYNTPRTNYINNAVRIEDLNNYANTLSVKTKAKVIIITDACHSGNLAGSDFKGSFLVGEQLKTVLNNEIRMTSCAPDQLSVEDRKWGGGSGVFTYYLLKGLKGLADALNDGNVNVKEISSYMEAALKNDPILKMQKHKQTPIVKGKEGFVLAKVDNNALSKLVDKSADAVSPLIVGLAPLEKNLSTHFFDVIANYKVEKVFDFVKLASMDSKEITHAMQTDSIFTKKVYEGNLFQKNPKYDTAKLSAFAMKLKSSPDALKRCNKQLVEIISERGQEIINLFLEGDAAEIERRRYYNTIKNEYGIYASMFEVALKLADAKSPLAKILRIKYHYFNGIALRLKLFTAKDTTGIIDSAFAEQSKAYQLEENAAYIHLELGILHSMKGNVAAADSFYKKAIDIAPTWVIPWSNLASLAIQRKEFDKGLLTITKADSLQKDYHPNIINAGILYMQKNDWLMAEELFRKAIALNSRHYLPFEKLGFVYTNTTQYELADSFFYEAEIRKLGYNMGRVESPFADFHDKQVITPTKADCMWPQKINEDDIMTYFVKGWLLWQNWGDEVGAELAFKKVIQIDKRNPLAFQYLGKLMWQQGRWQEVDLYLNYAIKYHLNEMEFAKYCDSVAKFLTDYKGKDCIEYQFRKSNYPVLDDYFILADAYENWRHYGEAEVLYEKAISIDSLYKGGYFKLWQLHEKLRRYNDAETVLYRYKNKMDDGLAQLNSFYSRVTAAIPNSGEWFYRAGSFHYKEATSHPELYEQDIYINEPDKGINLQNKDTLYADREWGDEKPFIINSTNYVCKDGDIINFPKRKSIVYLLKADTLLSDADIDKQRKEELADINAKIGDMYVAMNSTMNAFPYYHKSVLYQGYNAGTRLKLVDTWDANYHFQEAMKQLDTLLLDTTINYPKLLLLAKYRIHSSRFDSVPALLQRAQSIHPYKMPEIDDLFGRLYLMSKKYDSAAVYFQKYLLVFPTDASTMYALAKNYYSKGDVETSFEWLKKSIDAGFKCYWVLKYDPLFEKERSSLKWKEYTAKIEPKPFPDKNPSND